MKIRFELLCALTCAVPLSCSPAALLPDEQPVDVSMPPDGEVPSVAEPPRRGEGEGEEGAPLPIEVAVRAPAPGRAAPLNLRTLSLAAPSASAQRPPSQFVLVSEQHRVAATFDRAAANGVVIARLPPFEAPCRPLCPGARYRVETEDGTMIAAAGVRGEVLTGTTADEVAPIITSARTIVRGDRLIIELEASEPVLARGVVRNRWGVAEYVLDAPLVPETSFFLETIEPLDPESEHFFAIAVEDLAGNFAEPIELVAHTPPRIEVRITEVVPAPMHDWSDSDGIGTPFDAYPGTGAVSPADEWIELVNLSNAAIDLAAIGLVLRVIDSTPSETSVEAAPGLYFGDGGTRGSWWPGEALVVRPRGSISQRAFAIEIVSGTRLLDRLVIGEGEHSALPSGTPPDLLHESIARRASGDFAWCVPTPGDPIASDRCL